MKQAYPCYCCARLQLEPQYFPKLGVLEQWNWFAKTNTNECHPQADVNLFDSSAVTVFSTPFYHDQQNPYLGVLTYEIDSYTGNPIFILTAYYNNVEMGRAEFYKHPLLCRTADGARHNLIKQTGIFTQFNPETRLDKIVEVCDSMPPSSIDKFNDGLASGSIHGFFRGGSKVVQAAIIKHGYSHSSAEAAKTLFYYLGMFATTAVQHYA